MAVNAENVPEEQTIWYVHTGCSNHMTGSKSSFTNLNEKFRSIVSFGDLSTVNVTERVISRLEQKMGVSKSYLMCSMFLL